jgi:hypothetical protein
MVKEPRAPSEVFDKGSSGRSNTKATYRGHSRQPPLQPPLIASSLHRPASP